jgi:hypothetical protein
MKRLPHTLLPLCAAELDLRKRGPLLLKNIHPVRNARATAQLPHQKKGLVESSFSQALLMKRDRKDQVKALRIPIIGKPLRHPFSKDRTKTDFPFIFPTMDCLLEGPLIMSQCPCHCKIFPFRHTSTTGMAIHFG